ncbi:DUF1835 domain-containing protein [Bacillus sp. UNC41MFS5]|uniref:DUF1835 domain-containing protein n=1 Tax=Bacillus sp. UNC41MFS5 TaxID=1449046 RepID=UPI0009DCD0B8|nr:DUF1835 domain-containing protein [Bacillus sp. UNC41MFS5]
MELPIEELKKIVKDLPEREVRSYLYHILLNTSLLECKEYTAVEFSNHMKEIYNHILYPQDPITTFDREGNYQKVHITFGYQYLKPILKEMGIHKEEPVISIHDNFAVAPITNLHNESGQQKRYEWIKSSLRGLEEEVEEYIEEIQKAFIQIHSIPKEVPINIWVCDNAHEQTGLLFVLFLLRERTNPITIFNTTKLYSELFKAKAKKYTPLHSGEIPSEELRAIFKYGQENQICLTEVERNQFENQWLSLSKHDGTLRLWENGEIKNVSEDYFDEFIIEMAQKVQGKRKKKVFIPALRIIGEVYGRIEQYVGDDFLEYRLRKLIEKGIFEYEGTLEAMRSYRVKLT